MSKVWYKWPKGYVSDLVPWYNVIRRLLAAPFQLIGFAIMYFGELLGYGLSSAERLRKDLF